MGRNNNRTQQPPSQSDALPEAETATATATETLVSHDEDPMLTFSEAAELIGKSAPTIHRWVNEGLLAAVRDPSGLRRIRKSELEQFYGATAMAKAAADKQARLNRMREERAQWNQEIDQMVRGYDPAKKSHDV